MSTLSATTMITIELVLRKAKAWVSSNEGQEKIRKSLVKALEVTDEFRKTPPVDAQSYRVPFFCSEKF